MIFWGIHTRVPPSFSYCKQSVQLFISRTPLYLRLFKIISETQKFPLTRPPNHPHIFAHPGPFRGAYHDRHETWAGDAVDAAVSGAQAVAGRDQLRERPVGGQTDGIEAYGEIVWIRR